MMGGEHLPISNYDQLPESEIKQKLDVLAQSGNLNTQAIREYEEQTQKRSSIIQKLNELEQQGAPAPAQEPQGETPLGEAQERTEPGGAQARGETGQQQSAEAQAGSSASRSKGGS